jgi:purine-binding chemotaxis protein CheW
MIQPENLAEDIQNYEEKGELDQEQVEQIWAQRAAQMAQVEATEEPGEQLVVTLLRLGRELLGLEVRYVQDIRPKETLTRVPRVPNWVAGVTNLRGRILSVIDLRAYLGLPAPAQPEDGILVLVQSPTMELIFLVDDVPGVEVLPVRQDLAGDTLIHHLRAEYVRAVVERRASPADQRHITVLNVEALLADPRIVIHESLA